MTSSEERRVQPVTTTGPMQTGSLEEEIPGEPPATQSLSTLLRHVQQTVKTHHWTPTWIIADVQSITVTSNHHYMDVAEYDIHTQKLLAKARAVIWSGNAMILVKFRKATGEDLAVHMKVLIQVRPEFTPLYGLNLIILDISPEFSEGLMKTKIAKIIEQLTDNGLLERQKALPTPFDFHRIALLAPRKAAGLEDFTKILEPVSATAIVTVDRYDAVFEGPSSTQALVTALRDIARTLHDNPDYYDALVIVRGGGDSTGLKYLNEYAIAELICQLPVPVITGIGHERDTTVVDHVAHKSLPTPSAVASYINDTVIGNARIAWSDNRAIKQHLDGRLNEYLADLEQSRLRIHRRLETLGFTRFRQIDELATRIRTRLHQESAQSDALSADLEKRAQLAVHAYQNRQAKNLDPLWNRVIKATSGHISRFQAWTSNTFLEIWNRINHLNRQKDRAVSDLYAHRQTVLMSSIDGLFRGISDTRYHLLETQSHRLTQLREELESLWTRVKTVEQANPLQQQQQLARLRQSIVDRLGERMIAESEVVAELQIAMERAQQRLRTDQQTRKQRLIINILIVLFVATAILLAMVLMSK